MEEPCAPCKGGSQLFAVREVDDVDEDGEGMDEERNRKESKLDNKSGDRPDRSRCAPQRGTPSEEDSDSLLDQQSTRARRRKRAFDQR